MARRHIVGGLDIGTTKVVAIIAEVGPNGYPIIKGLGESPTVGIRKGVVFDKDTFSKSMAHAVWLSQTMANENLNSFYVTYPVTNQSTGKIDLINEDLVECIRLAGLKIEEMLPSVVASAEALLTDTDKELGTVLMDIGGTTTGLMVYNQGLPVYENYLAAGSEHITSDLAVCLHTTMSEGERIKQSLGLIIPATDDFLEISSVGGQIKRNLPARSAIDIIKSRVVEILDLTHQELRSFCRLDSLAGGMIMTGGGSLLKGLLDTAKSQFPFSKVAMGVTSKAGVPREEWASPAYTSSVGLVVYAAKRSSRRLGRLSGWREVLDRLR